MSRNSYNAEQIADYFIWKASQETDKDRKHLTNKKLQKLLYYAQAWSLVVRKEKLFKEKIEAWVHGPAIRSIYNEYKIFGFNPIKKEIDSKKIEKLPKGIVNFLNEVWSVYGKFDASYLELLTHSENPWQKAREGVAKSESSSNEISLKEMEKFYAEKLKTAS